jgi:hypothetical protein
LPAKKKERSKTKWKNLFYALFDVFNDTLFFNQPKKLITRFGHCLKTITTVPLILYFRIAADLSENKKLTMESYGVDDEINQPVSLGVRYNDTIVFSGVFTSVAGCPLLRPAFGSKPKQV